MAIGLSGITLFVDIRLSKTCRHPWLIQQNWVILSNETTTITTIRDFVTCHRNRSHYTSCPSVCLSVCLSHSGS